MTDITLYGGTGSPFVRKLQIGFAEKGLDYEQEQTIPSRVPLPAGVPLGWITPALAPHTPLGKIPFVRIGERWLADSSIVLAYLERLYPDPPLYPADAWDCAQATWYEEFIDGGAYPKLFSTIFFERRIAPMLFGRPTNEAVVEAAIADELPRIYGYLDEAAGERRYLVGERFTIADLSVAAFFESMRQAEVPPDAARFPRLVRYLAAIERHPSVAAVLAAERGAGG